MRYPASQNNAAGLRRSSVRTLRFESLEDRRLLSATPLSEASGIYGPPSQEQFSAYVSESVEASNACIDLSSVTNEQSSATNSTDGDDALGTPVNAELLDEQVYEKASDFKNSKLIVGGDECPSISELDVHPFSELFEQSSSAESNENNDVGTYFLSSESGSGGSGGESYNVSISTELSSSVDALSSTTRVNPLLESRAAVNGAFSIENVDSLKINLPNLPDGYYATVTLGGSAVYNQDYLVYFHSNVNAGYYSVSVDETLIYYWGASGGFTELYIVPIDNSVAQQADRVATFTLNSPQQNGSGGSEVNFTYGVCSASVTLIDDDLEFIADDDPSSAGQDQSTVQYVVNNDSYNLSFIYGKPTVNANNPNANTVVKESFTTTQSSDPLVYSIVSTNGNNYFQIDAQTGKLSWNSLPEDQTYDFDLTIKVANAEVPDLIYDTATVKFTVGWASFVLLVSQPVHGESTVYTGSLLEAFSNGEYDNINTGHTSWIIEATSSLLNLYNEDGSHVYSLGGLSFEYTEVAGRIGKRWGYRVINQNVTSDPLDLVGEGILENETGDDETNYNPQDDVYRCFTIPSRQYFENCLIFTDYMYHHHDQYSLATHNCTNVAIQAAGRAGIQVNTSVVHIHLTDDEALGFSLGTLVSYQNGSTNFYLSCCPGQLGQDLLTNYNGIDTLQDRQYELHSANNY